jgi:hypothetical protein
LIWQAGAVTSPGFIYVFIQVAIIAPVAEELAKPLATLAVIDRLSQRDAFLVGAMAGSDFAAVENVLYTGFGFHFWAGILVVWTLGGAIHPLSSGLSRLGWRDFLRGKPKVWRNWLARFGVATGMHAFWNGGSLLVITLAGAQFFGELPPEIDVLGRKTLLWPTNSKRLTMNNLDSMGAECMLMPPRAKQSVMGGCCNWKHACSKKSRNCWRWVSKPMRPSCPQAWLSKPR